MGDLPPLPSTLSFLDVSPKKRKKKFNQPPKENRYPKPGQPAIHTKFPEAVQSAERFINENRFRADRHRASDTGLCGVTSKQLRNNVLVENPRLLQERPNLCVKTPRRWMQPADRKHNAASTYYGLIEAKVPHKNNDVRVSSDDDHFFAARVRYTLEFTARYPTISRVISVDNKYGVKVGSTTTAVDRHLNITRFFPTRPVEGENEPAVPRYVDHDFPIPGYVLTPSGILTMTPYDPPELLQDNGRQRYKLPIHNVTGVTVFNRCPKTPTTVVTHMNDIIDVMRPVIEDEGVKILTMIADGGADYNTNHEINKFYFGRLFRRFPQLDVLIITSYAPGQSAMNMIERAWCPLTRSLVSVYFPSTLEGDRLPPRQQTGLTRDEQEERECDLFDRSLDKLKRHWDHVQYRGNDVNIVTHYSRQPEEPYTNEEYRELKPAVTATSTVGLHRHPEIAEEYNFASKHSERRISMLIFTKCSDEHCARCLHSPVGNQEALNIAKRFPSPRPAEGSHLTTFLQEIAKEDCGVNPDTHMPRYRAKGLGRCDICNKYVYTSKADREKHRKKAHPPQRLVLRAQRN